jgi:EAL domain-containing protein (putative c-di-GMP-specific phosphodiesterase class I)
MLDMPSPVPDAFAELGSRLLAATRGLRTAAVSWHDARGRVLWSSEPLLTLQQREAIRDGLEAFSGVSARMRIDCPLPGQQLAVLQRVVDGRGLTAGFAMLRVDARVLQAKGLRADLPVPALRIVEEFSRLLAGRATAVAAVLPAATGTAEPAEPAEAGEVLQAARLPAVELEREYAALRAMQLALHVQPLVALRPSARTRRFEVLLRATDPGSSLDAAPLEALERAARSGLGTVLDRRVVSLVIFWLRQRADIVEGGPCLFSVNLTENALVEDHFLKFLGSLLERAGLPRGVLAVELQASVLARHPARAARVAAALESMGCGLVLDDHTMSGDEIALLELPGLRMVKLHPALVAASVSPFSQGLVAACAQIAKSCGFFTVAKHVEGEALREHLRLLGVDFLQGFAWATPHPIESVAPLGSIEDAAG